MKINIIKILALVFLFTQEIYAINAINKVNLGAKFGTTGFGLEFRTQINDNFYARFGGNYIHYNKKLRTAPLEHKTKLILFTVPIMIDYHPRDNSGFRVSGGIAYNGNMVKAKSSPKEYATLNNNRYSPQQLGDINSEMKFNKLAPIISMGYDNSFINDTPWSFNAEVGLMYAGKPKIKINSTGSAAGSDQQRIDVNRNANETLSRAKNLLRVFPIVTFGFKYHL